MYDEGGELLIVFQNFLLNIFQGWLAFLVELRFFLILRNFIKVVWLHLFFVAFELFEGAVQGSDLDSKSFFHWCVHF